MSKTVKIIQTLMDLLKLRSLHALKKDGYLVDVGWFRSFEEKKSLDKDGNPIPWIAYPAIDFIESKLKDDMIVFEFGSGASTAWWAKRVKEIDAVEHDKNWFEIVQKNKPVNSNIFWEAEESYFTKVCSMDKKYDIIFIDGQNRNNCVIPALEALKENGVIIWDDSQCEEYLDSYEELYKNGFKRLFFTGISPIYNNKVETSIFYRVNNCFEI
jgi:precorrin-6B methylase 2